MSDLEIIQSYREAKYPHDQIKILSELTLKPRKEIINILQKAGCTVKAPRVNPLNKSVKVSDEEIMKLYRQGMKDIEIAKILHVKRTFLCEWRKARKLKTNYKQKYKCDRDKLKVVMSQGKTLDEMAEIFGVSRSTVYRWEMEMKQEV